MKVVAIDYGERRVGLAVSNPEGTIALALPVFEMKGDRSDVDRLAEAVAALEPERVVFGLPLNMDGTEGPAVERVRSFAVDFGLRIEVPVEFWDERLTSEEAKRRLRGVPLSRGQKRSHTNTVSAQIILESYLQGGRR